MRNAETVVGLQRERHGAHETVTGEPVAGTTVRRLTRRQIAPSGGRGSGGGDLGAARLTWTRKREGTTAWRGRAERRGDTQGASVLSPLDIAKRRTRATHVPPMETCTPSDTVSDIVASSI